MHSLSDSERLAAVLIIIVAVVFILSNLFMGRAVIPPSEENFRRGARLIEVSVEGEVKYPGTYQVKEGTLVAEVLKRAQPLLAANLKSIKQDSKISRRRRIRVPGTKRLTKKEARQ